MFPQGGPGVALLLLRICVAVTVWVNAWSRSGVWATRALFAGAVLMAALLTIGLLTPYISVLVCLAAVATLVLGSDSVSTSHILLICVAAALALLGPGAYSVDSRLFGRR